MQIGAFTTATDLVNSHVHTGRSLHAGSFQLECVLDGIARLSAKLDDTYDHGIRPQHHITVFSTTAPHTQLFRGIISNATISPFGIEGHVGVSIEAAGYMEILKLTRAIPMVYSAQADSAIIEDVLFQAGLLGTFYRKLAGNGTNSITYSYDLSQASVYTFTNATRIDNDITDPEGTTNGTKLNDNGTNAQHYVEVSLSTATNNEKQWCSVRVKRVAGELGHVRLVLVTKSGAVRYATFDLSTGARVNTSGNCDAWGYPRGGGWITYTIAADIQSGGTTPVFRVLTMQDATTDSYAGSGTGFHVWGFQWNKDVDYDSDEITTNGATVTVTNIATIDASMNFTVGGDARVLDVLRQIATAAGGFINERAGVFSYNDGTTESAAFDLSDTPNGTTTRRFLRPKLIYDNQDFFNKVRVFGGKGPTGLDVVVTGTNAASVTTNGEAWGEPRRFPGIADETVLQDLADALCTKHGSLLTGVDCVVEDDGLLTGAEIDVTSSGLQLTAESLVIGTIRIKEDAPGDNRYTLKLGQNHRREEALLAKVNAATIAGIAPVVRLGVDFDGTNDFLKVTTSSVFNNLNQSGLTLSFLVKFDSLAGDQYIIYKDAGWYCYENGSVIKFVALSAGADPTWASDVTLVAGRVYHVVVAWNGGNATGDCIIRIDGKGGSSGGSAGTPTDEGLTNLEIGREYNLSSGWLNGWISNLSVWNTQLQATNRGTLAANPGGEQDGAIMPGYQLSRWRMDYGDVGDTLTAAGTIIDEWGTEHGDPNNSPTIQQNTYFPYEID